MPSKNTDAQNNFLYACNILRNECNTSPGFPGGLSAYRELTQLRDRLFNTDGEWAPVDKYDVLDNDFSDGSMVKSPTMYSDSDTWVSNDESRITPVDELAPWEIELMRDIYEGYRSPNRVELDDIAFLTPARTDERRSYVFFTDGTTVQSNGETVHYLSKQSIIKWRDVYESYRWPNRVELSDILMASTWTTRTSNGASFVWFKQNGKYYTGHAESVSSSFVKSDEDWRDIRNNWEEYYWPNRIRQSDINFIGMTTNRLGASESVVFTNQGNWWATGTHIPQTRPSHNTRDACENYRWPNRVSMDNILGWRPKNHNHVYLGTGDPFGTKVNIYCHITDKEF